MSALMEARIAGIPCTVRVDSYVCRAPDRNSWASDWDYEGYTEMDYTICDQRGRPAPWLERKMTPADTAGLEAEIHTFMGNGDD